MRAWIEQLLAFPGMAGMGHGQRAEDANLGLGWVYYSLARALRPRVAVVIGSYRGFVPIVLGRAMMDNVEGGVLHFIDPSLVDDFWKDPAEVRAHFDSRGARIVRHHLATTQQFVQGATFGSLAGVGMLFIDGYHTAEQAEFDHTSFMPTLADDALVLFHDSICVRPSRIYGDDRSYTHSVKHYVDRLRVDPAWQVLDLPIDGGVSLVRRVIPSDGGAGA